MSSPDLGSPIWRIAAGTGEEPADIEAAVAALVADDMPFAEVWKVIADGVMDGNVVREVERVLAVRAGCLPFPYERTREG